MSPLRHYRRFGCNDNHFHVRFTPKTSVYDGSGTRRVNDQPGQCERNFVMSLT
jgi:hypothetical protein